MHVIRLDIRKNTRVKNVNEEKRDKTLILIGNNIGRFCL